MSEQERMKEYRQGDTVHLTVEMRDPNGVSIGTAAAVLEGGGYDDPTVDLAGWPEGEEQPEQAEFVMEGEIEQQPPGVYVCYAIVGMNSYAALSRHELVPPLRFRILEHPDDVREGPEVLSVGGFW